MFQCFFSLIMTIKQILTVSCLPLTPLSFNVMKFIIKLVLSLSWSWFLWVRVNLWINLPSTAPMSVVIKSPWEFLKSKERLKTCSLNGERFKTTKECSRLRWKTSWSIDLILGIHFHGLIILGTMFWTVLLNPRIWTHQFPAENCIFLFPPGLVFLILSTPGGSFSFFRISQYLPSFFSSFKIKNVQLWKCKTCWNTHGIILQISIYSPCNSNRQYIFAVFASDPFPSF